jgi:SAM-dependent methyltransferase
MEAMSWAELLLEQSLVYRLWQAPFADQKFAPVIAHNDLARVRRALDVGCGPGTNSRYFRDSQYLGIDINPRYIAAARRRYGLEFQAIDARLYRPVAGQRFDFILINSFLHHLNSGDVVELLAHVRSLLTEDGYVHILEPELPASRSLAYFLAKADRGKFVRPLEEWESFFSASFQPALLECYPLRAGPFTLWKMLYFKGGPKK